MRNRTISNGDNIIDSRDVLERIAELESERETLADEVTTATEAVSEEEKSEVDSSNEREELQDKLEAAQASLTDWDDDNGKELKDLKAFEDEGSREWRHGCMLIREDYFETYAREYAEEVGAISREDRWPCTCIDWERAAEELKHDYTGADFDGVTYYYQS